jgi:hypothetical protein
MLLYLFSPGNEKNTKTYERTVEPFTTELSLPDLEMP